jgi:CBS domain-containing protein
MKEGRDMNSRIKDIMTRDVECATPDMSVREAAERMKSRNIGSLPVCQGKKVVGVITDRDITIRSTAGGNDPNATKVDSVMSREVVCVKADDSIRDAEQIMHDRQLRRLCVIDDSGDLVGYLAIAKIARQESPAQAGRVFRGVSQPSTPKKLAEIAVRKGSSKS